MYSLLPHLKKSKSKKINKQKSKIHQKIKFHNNEITHIQDKLDNGLKYKFINHPGKKSVIVNLAIKAGSINEPENKSGLAHFVEHMLFNGTTNKSSQTKLTYQLEKYGAKINGSTSFNTTQYYVKIASNKADKAISVFADMLKNSEITDEDIENEKSIVVHEMLSKYDNPDIFCNKHIISQHLKKTPYYKIGIGSPDTINNITKTDILAFILANYKPSNILLLVYGNIKNAGKLQGLVEDLFSGNILQHYRNFDIGTKQLDSQLQKFREYNKKVVAELNPSIIRKNIVWKNGNFKSMVNTKLNQTYIRICFNGCPINCKTDKFQNLAIYLLSTGMSSKLFDQVRDKEGLSYSTKIDVYDYKNVGLICFRSNTSSKKEDVQKTINIIIEQLSKLKNKIMTEKKLKMAKTQKKHYNKLNTYKMTKRSMSYAVDTLFGKETKQISITPQKLKDYYINTFKLQNMSILVYGPKKYSKTDFKLSL